MQFYVFICHIVYSGSIYNVYSLRGTLNILIWKLAYHSYEYSLNN